MTDFFRRNQKHFNLTKFVNNALQEDVLNGDCTGLATIPKKANGHMHLLAKEPGIIAGVEAAERILKKISPRIKFHSYKKDGENVKKGDIVFEVSGNMQKLLLSERLILNVMQRMSGIATHTARLQALCKGTKAKVCDTRKTTPGFRFFEKWAVAIGGGANHRFGLYDMILIKDNHIDFSGGNKEALLATHKYLKKTGKRLAIEIETRSLNDVKEVMKLGGFNRIMFDNFTIKQTKEAVKLVGGLYETESSGGITEKNLADYARCGVDFISVGALTHQVKSMDLSLKVKTKANSLR